MRQMKHGVFFIKALKEGRIFLMLQARVDIKEHNLLGSTESISQTINKSIDRKRLLSN